MKKLIIFMLFFLSINLQAQAVNISSSQTNQVTKLKTATTKNNFDLIRANQYFDRINIKLSTENLNITDLNEAVETLTQLANQADQCNTEMQKKITNVTELIAQDADNSATNKQSADLVYLNNEKATYSNQQSQCRLFSIRAKEAIDAYKSTIASLIQKKTLTKGRAWWELIPQLRSQPVAPNLLPFLLTIMNTIMPPSLLLFSFAICAFIFAFYILKKIQRYLSFKAKAVYYVPFILLSLLAIGINILFILLYSLHQAPIYSEANQLVTILGISFLSLFLVGIAFTQKSVRAYFLLHHLDILFFQRFFIIAIILETVNLLGSIVLSALSPNDPYSALVQSIFLVITLISSLWFIRYFCYVHQHLPFIRKHTPTILFSTGVLILATMTLDMLGYNLLAKNLTNSSLITIGLLLFIYLLTISIQNLYLSLYRNPSLVRYTTKYFDYKKNQTYYEFLILKFTAQFLIIALGIYIIGENWDFMSYYIERFYANILDGIHFASIMIYPLRLIYGIVIFCLLFLCFRMISTQIMRYHQFQDGEETQVALASILTYIGFSFSLISGLLVAGFDFTGLAIIAGALSVGIGLGLQSIVNNFVSGIILLLEKPIRPGDRINIDGIEGFVKKIRVRSTQVITPAREDIIIPNSDLITKRVTNYMFTDSNVKINCEVGVAYGTEPTVVRDILLEIAKQHDDIIKTGKSKPMVLFKSFGESAMIFQLGCLIKDVNKRFVVQSDLNYAIEEAFRKHNIAQPFPQRELHIKFEE